MSQRRQDYLLAVRVAAELTGRGNPAEDNYRLGMFVDDLIDEMHAARKNQRLAAEEIPPLEQWSVKAPHLHVVKESA